MFLGWEDDDYVAQCVLFFFAGFDTISTLLTFMGHELTINPDVQEKLYQEILETKNNLGDGPLTYDVLSKMKYLDMVVSETLRIWNPTVLSDRIVTKPYILKISDGHSIQLKPGDPVTFPTAAIHLDPKYFPNPKKFDPLRFCSENIQNIKSGTYFPFGLGPRNCIGSRFALMEAKSIFFDILLNVKLMKCARTENPIQLKTRTFNLNAKNGFWIKFMPRY